MKNKKVIVEGGKKCKKYLLVQSLSQVLILLLLSGLTLAVTIQTDEDTYQPDEMVRINISDWADGLIITIISENDYYKFLGVPNGLINFAPEKTGNYVVNAQDGKTGAILDSTSFEVIENPKNAKVIYESQISIIEKTSPDDKINTSVNLSSQGIFINKYTFKLNEKVLIKITHQKASQIIITNGKDVFKFLGTKNDTITFIPRNIGVYDIIIKDSSGGDLAKKGFEVVPTGSIKRTLIINEKQKADSYQSIILNKIDKKLFLKYKNSKNVTIIPQIKDSNNRYIKARIQTLSKTFENYTITGVELEEFHPEIIIEPLDYPDLKIRLEEINISNGLSLTLDVIDSGKINLNNKRIKKGFFVGNLNKDLKTAQLIFTASGSELYECDNYSMALESCNSNWRKILDLTPGQDYTINLSSSSMGFTETGVATINTKRPIYHPGEAAEIVMAVLDNEGYLVSDADVELIVITPGDIVYSYSTSGQISETSKGVYEMDFFETSIEGNYSMIVKALAPDVNYSMSSEFFIKQNYEFDIIRKTPVTFDPWQGPYLDEIDISPKISVSGYSFTEIIPFYYKIIDTYGGSVQSVNGTKRITWANLSGETTVKALIQSPLRSPYLDIFGKSYVDYGADRFYEARNWYVAVDPTTSWRVLSDTYQFSDGISDVYLALPVSLMDVSRAFMIMQSSGDSGARNADRHQVTGYIVNTTHIRLTRDSTSDTPSVSWFIIENNGTDIYVQRGEISVGSAATSNTGGLTNSVDTTKSFVIANTRSDASDRNSIHEGYGRVELQDSSTVLCARQPTGSIMTCRYEVVESRLKGLTVQTGTTTITGTSAFATLPNSVNMSRTLVYFTHDSAENGLTRLAIGAQLTSSTRIDFYRFTGTYNNVIRWYAIQFPPGTNVQRGSIDGSTDTTSLIQNAAIPTAVDLSRSFAFVSATSDGTGTAFPRQRWIYYFTRDDNLRMERFYSGQEYWLYWQAVELPPPNLIPNVTTLHYPPNGSTVDKSNVDFNFTVVDDSNYLAVCYLYINETGAFSIVKNVTNVQNDTESNITYELDDGTYLWNIECEDYYTSTDFYNQNYTVTVRGVANVKINDIEGDTSETFSFTNRTPTLNITITNRDATCYISEFDENYTEMVLNGRTNCGSFTKGVWKTCAYPNTLPIGNDYLYISCNTSFGVESNSSNNKDISVDVLCDSHSDCAAGEYCNIIQDCTTDVITGYSCESLAYGGGNDNEVCSTNFCTPDTWDFIGYFCAADSDDCVYNNGGSSYDLNYALCSTSQYKVCNAGQNWSGFYNCSLQNEGDDQNATASTHSGYNCSYYAADQACLSGDLDLGSYGCSGNTTDCGSYVYLGGGSCGSVQADCDVGCGAECDVDNSTSPEIVSGTCYYDKSCSAVCAWSQNSEEAPAFCIDDSNGGPCAYSNRTNPANSETCYFSASCQNSIGANLDSSDSLRQDYCDFCNSTGNYSGGYAPAPNASCSSGCADSGTIYYDAGATPLDRSDDCDGAGSPNIFSDTLSIGDVWNGSAPAYCNDTECNADCGVLIGVCSAGVCVCTDTDYPLIILSTPLDNDWQSSTTLVFFYNVTDAGSGIENCSLIVDGSIVNTSINPTENVWNNFTRTEANGQYIWNITCFDNSTSYNQNTSETRTVGVDGTLPVLSNAQTVGTPPYDINDQICLKVTVTDTFSGIKQVWAAIDLPGGGSENVYLSDSVTSSCDAINGDGVYSTDYTLIFSGDFNWTDAYATDFVPNQNSISVGSTWNVTTGGNLTVNMTKPTANLEINESESNYFFSQTCNATCNEGITNCNEVYLFAQYLNNSVWSKIQTTGTELLIDTANYSCGNLSAEGAPWWNSSYNYRKRLSISGGAAANYSVMFTMDTTGPDILDSGNDVRIVYWDGEAGNEIDRVSANGWDNAASQIWFKTQTAISGISYDYYVYYGYSSAGTPPESRNNVYIFYDDFEDGDINGWSNYSSGNVVYATSDGGSNGVIQKTSNNDPNGGYTMLSSTISDFEATYRIMRLSGGSGGAQVRHALEGGGTGFDGYGPRFTLFSGASGTMAIEIRNNGASGGNLVTASYTAAYDTWYSVTYRKYGTTLEAYMYNSSGGLIQSVSTTDSTYNSFDRFVIHGGYTFNTDDIKVRLYQSSEPALSVGDAELYPPDNSTCQFAFNISSAPTSGNNTYPVRCMASSANSPTTFSGNVSVTVNDHPVAAIDYPQAGSWANGVISINASSSFDSDGNITNYLYEIDNNTGFTTPSTLCSTTDANCTFNTSSQTQCADSVMGCYLRLIVTDNDGLTNSTTILFGIDNTGPTSTLDRPLSFENITSSSYTLNASAADSGVGNISYVMFEYRYNESGSWKPACNDTDGAAPYKCTLNLTAFSDGDEYEFRVLANDTLGNLGGYDTHTNITIDRNGPVSSLIAPVSFTNISTNVFIVNATASDAFSGVDSVIFEYRQNPTADWFVICTNTTGTAYYICTWDVTFLSDGNQYEVRVLANDTLGNLGGYEFAYNITIDRQGPITTIQDPLTGANIWGASYTLNASATDAYSPIDTVIFEYRVNASDTWKSACTSTIGPTYFNCSWNIGALADGNNYQIRAQANDTLGNLGSYDTETSITIDNNGPQITLISPGPGITDGDGNLVFTFDVNDVASDLTNCSLLINGTTNQTNSAISEGQNSFSLTNLSNGDYTWAIRCTDDFVNPNTQTSGTRTFTVDIKYVMLVNVSTDKSQYQVGNQLAEQVNITTLITDLYSQPLVADITLDITKPNGTATWWNTTWAKRKPIFISSSSGQNRTNLTISLSVTGLGGDISSCVNEIRVASVTNEEMTVNIVGGDDSTYCDIIFKADVSANANNENNYFVYYDNPSASDPGYSTIPTTFNIFFEDFENTSNWDDVSGGGGEDPANGCGFGIGDFNNCDDNSNDYDFGVTDGVAEVPDGYPISGTYMHVMDDWTTWVSTAGIWYNFNPQTVCSGGVCEDITVSGWVSASSLDNSGEWCRVWARNTAGSAYTTIYNCADGGACEFSQGASDIPTQLSHWDYFSQNLNQDLGLGVSSSTNFSVHIGSDQSGSGDQCYYEDIAITGTKTNADNITAKSVGATEEWVNRTTGQSDTEGGFNYIWDPFNQTAGYYSAVSFAIKILYSDTWDNQIFELINDSILPNVTLVSPGNGTEHNSSVTFTYKVNDTLSSIINCSLFIDDALDQTETFIQEGPTQFFYPYIPAGGWHNWSVCCYDFYLNYGCSENRSIYIKPPDLEITGDNIAPSDSAPKINQNIAINATIFNIGGSSAYNVTAQFYDGDPDSGGIQIGSNFTFNLTDNNGNNSNVTISTSYVIPRIGPIQIYVVVDPPTATNGSIFELREYNNKNFTTLNVPAWHTTYGDMSALYVLGTADNSTEIIWNRTSFAANIFATETGLSIDWTSLHALGRKTDNTTSDNNDFEELDSALNMTGFIDSVNLTYTNSGLPKALMTFLVYSSNLINVPVVNSTINDNFVSGILWDTSDGGAEYSGIQDIVFVTKVNLDSVGAYGTYDYEITYPSNLMYYKEAVYDTVDIYYELQ